MSADIRYPELYKKRPGHYVYHGHDIKQTLEGWTAWRHGERVASAVTLNKVLDMLGDAS